MPKNTASGSMNSSLLYYKDTENIDHNRRAGPNQPAAVVNDQRQDSDLYQAGHRANDRNQAGDEGGDQKEYGVP